MTLSSAPTVLVRYWAAAKAAAGTAEEDRAAGDLAALLTAAAEQHGPDLARVLERCSYLVDGVAVGERAPAAVVLTDGAVVDVLPPFAGG